MKKVGILIVLLVMFASCVFAASSASSPSSDVDEKVDPDAPCTVVFDKTRMWVPETMTWKNKEWKCDKYDAEGIYCLRVIEVKEDSSSSENGESGRHAVSQ